MLSESERFQHGEVTASRRKLQPKILNISPLPFTLDYTLYPGDGEVAYNNGDFFYRTVNCKEK
jgi:hypothetical protein